MRPSPWTACEQRGALATVPRRFSESTYEAVHALGFGLIALGAGLLLVGAIMSASGERRTI